MRRWRRTDRTRRRWCLRNGADRRARFIRRGWQQPPYPPPKRENENQRSGRVQPRVVDRAIDRGTYGCSLLFTPFPARLLETTTFELRALLFELRDDRVDCRVRRRFAQQRQRLVMATGVEDLSRIPDRSRSDRIALLLLAALALTPCGLLCGTTCGVMRFYRRIAFADQSSKAWILRRKRLRLCQQRDCGLVLRRLAGLANEIGDGRLALARFLFSPTRLFLSPFASLLLASCCFPLPFFFETPGLFFPSFGLLLSFFLEPSRFFFSFLLREVLTLESRGVLRDLRMDASVAWCNRCRFVQKLEGSLVILRVLRSGQKIVQRLLAFANLLLAPPFFGRLSLNFLFSFPGLFGTPGLFGAAILVSGDLPEQLTSIAMIGLEREDGISGLPCTLRITSSEQVSCARKMALDFTPDPFAALGLRSCGSNSMDKLRVFDRADGIGLLQQHGRFVGTILGECPFHADQQRRNLLLTPLQFFFTLPPLFLLALLFSSLSLFLESLLGFEFGALPRLQFLPLTFGFLPGALFLFGNRDPQLR